MSWPGLQEHTGPFRDLRQELKQQLSLGPQAHFLLGISGGPGLHVPGLLLALVAGTRGASWLGPGSTTPEAGRCWDAKETLGLADFGVDKWCAKFL